MSENTWKHVNLGQNINESWNKSTNEEEKVKVSTRKRKWKYQQGGESESTNKDKKVKVPTRKRV